MKLGLYKIMTPIRTIPMFALAPNYPPWDHVYGVPGEFVLIMAVHGDLRCRALLKRQEVLMLTDDIAACLEFVPHDE